MRLTQKSAHSFQRFAPYFVALGAALWGTESAFRIPLGRVYAADVIVLYEHFFVCLWALPFLLFNLRSFFSAPKSALAYLLFSGIAGSAVGTIFFTKALQVGNPTVVNVVLNLQPAVSTVFGWLVFRDRLSRQFWLFAPLALAAGIALSLEHPGALLTSFNVGALDAGLGYALICALAWGLSTVAGRGAMLGLSLPVASAARFVIGLLAMAPIVFLNGHFTAKALIPAALFNWTPTAAWPNVPRNFFLLCTISGAIPLFFYFYGLKWTRASLAGYFEMAQTLAGAAITWGCFGHALRPHQVIAALVLMAAVFMLQRAQERAL